MKTSTLSGIIQADLYRRLIDDDFDGITLTGKMSQELEKKCKVFNSHELFYEWCAWHGFGSWSNTLESTIDELRNAEAGEK